MQLYTMLGYAMVTANAQQQTVLLVRLLRGRKDLPDWRFWRRLTPQMPLKILFSQWSDLLYTTDDRVLGSNLGTRID